MFRYLVFLGAAVALVSGHARLLDPPGRSSIWRFEEFAQYNPEPNYNDDELWCENIRQFENDTRCGICGDPVRQPQPRENEHGGRYGRGIIVRRYYAGDVSAFSSLLQKF